MRAYRDLTRLVRFIGDDLSYHGMLALHEEGSPAFAKLRSFRCLIPGFDGAVFSPELKDALWASFSTVAPQRRRQSVERYTIVKRA